MVTAFGGKLLRPFSSPLMFPSALLGDLPVLPLSPSCPQETPLSSSDSRKPALCFPCSRHFLSFWGQVTGTWTHVTPPCAERCPCVCVATCHRVAPLGLSSPGCWVPSSSSAAFSSASSVLVCSVLCSLSFLPCGGELREGEALGVERLWVLMAPPPASRDAGPVPSWAGLAGVRDSPGTGTSGAGGLVNAVQGCQRHSPRRSGHSVQTPGPQRSLSGGLGRERPAVGPGLAGQMLTRAVLSLGDLGRVTGVVTKSRHVCVSGLEEGLTAPGSQARKKPGTDTDACDPTSAAAQQHQLLPHGPPASPPSPR